MTVAVVTPEQSYLGNGSTAPMVVPFRFLAPDDLVVTKIDAGNVRTPWIRGVDFNVVGTNVVPTAVTVVGSTYLVQRRTPIQQPADYVTGDAFPEETHELALDRGIMVAQELDARSQAIAARALTLPVGELSSPLPNAASRASKILGFDINGAPFVYSVSSLNGAVLMESVLRDDLALNTGATLVRTSDGSTVQDKLTALAAGSGSNDGTTALALLGTETYPAAASKIGVTMDKTFVGTSGGASDYRGLLVSGKFTGGYGGFQLNAYHAQAEARHTAGVLSFLRSMEGYARLGLAGSSVGSIISMRVFEGHCANESASSAVTSGIVYYANDTDYADDWSTTGVKFGSSMGFASGNLGHASKVSTAAIGFNAGNMTVGAATTASFRSEQATGSNAWAFLGIGSAPSSFYGALRVGDNTRPADILEAKGYSKLTATGTITAVGTYHEMVSGAADYVLHIRNTNGSTPQALRLRLTGASPNNIVQNFLLCEDSTTSRALIRTNGNMINSNNSYAGISDPTLKTNRSPANSQTDDMRALNLENYQLISDVEAMGKDAAPRQLGLMSDAVRKVSPGLVDRGPIGSSVRSTVTIDGVEYPYEVESVREVDSVKYSVLALKHLGFTQEIDRRVVALERAGKKRAPATRKAPHGPTVRELVAQLAAVNARLVEIEAKQHRRKKS